MKRTFVTIILPTGRDWVLLLLLLLLWCLTKCINKSSTSQMFPHCKCVSLFISPVAFCRWQRVLMMGTDSLKQYYHCCHCCCCHQTSVSQSKPATASTSTQRPATTCAQQTNSSEHCSEHTAFNGQYCTSAFISGTRQPAQCTLTLKQYQPKQALAPTQPAASHHLCPAYSHSHAGLRSAHTQPLPHSLTCSRSRSMSSTRAGR